MKRVMLTFLLLILASCVPVFEPANGRATFTAESGVLYFGGESSVAYGSAAVAGDVTSRYLDGKTNGYAILRLPEGDWGEKVQVGRYRGEVSGFATIVLVGGSAGLDVDLVQR